MMINNDNDNNKNIDDDDNNRYERQEQQQRGPQPTRPTAWQQFTATSTEDHCNNDDDNGKHHKHVSWLSYERRPRQLALVYRETV